MKQGFLLAEETIKIVIALIAMIFLAYFLFSLYFANINQTKIVQAQQILDKSSEGISQTIQNLNDGSQKNLIIDNPQGWFIFSFTGTVKPNSCARKNCICICDKVSSLSITAFFSSIDERQSKQCVDAGACTIQNVVQFNPIEIKNPKDSLTQITIKKSGGKIEIQ